MIRLVGLPRLIINNRMEWKGGRMNKNNVFPINRVTVFLVKLKLKQIMRQNQVAFEELANT